jgi:peptidylprolyl isomerase
MHAGEAHLPGGLDVRDHEVVGDGEVAGGSGEDSRADGAGEVIGGWEIGIPGMKVGGRRQLVVPPWLGYGPAGYAQIPGNAVLVCMVDLVEAP